MSNNKISIKDYLGSIEIQILENFSYIDFYFPFHDFSNEFKSDYGFIKTSIHDFINEVLIKKLFVFINTLIEYDIDRTKFSSVIKFEIPDDYKYCHAKISLVPLESKSKVFDKFSITFFLKQEGYGGIEYGNFILMYKFFQEKDFQILEILDKRKREKLIEFQPQICKVLQPVLSIISDIEIDTIKYIKIDTQSFKLSNGWDRSYWLYYVINPFI